MKKPRMLHEIYDDLFARYMTTRMTKMFSFTPEEMSEIIFNQDLIDAAEESREIAIMAQNILNEMEENGSDTVLITLEDGTELTWTLPKDDDESE